MLDYHVLYRRITDKLVEGKMNYLFLDEIQLVPNFERAMDSLFIKNNVDLYIRPLVKQIASFLADVAGGLVTIKRIADALTSLEQKTTSKTVLTYLSAFLFYRSNRYDIVRKRYLSINSKYYPVDPALRRALLGNKRPNLGHRLENIVYIELKRRGYEIYVGNVGNLKIDFVAIKDGVTEYYQVSLTNLSR